MPMKKAMTQHSVDPKRTSDCDHLIWRKYRTDLFCEFFGLRCERPEGARNHGHRTLNIDVHRPYLGGIFYVAALGGKVGAGTNAADLNCGNKEALSMLSESVGGE